MRFYLSSAALILSIALLGIGGSLVAAQERSAVPAKVEAAAQDPQIMQLMAEGDKLFGQKEYQKAIEVYQKALEIAKAGDRISDVANLNNKLGNTYYRLEKYAEAIEVYQVSLSNYQKLDDRPAIAQAWANLGYAYFYAKDYSQAINSYQQALEIAKTNNNTSEVANLNNRIGNTYYRLKKYTEAIEFYKISLTNYQKIGDSSVPSYIWSNLGNSYYDSKDYSQAINSYEKALELEKHSNNSVEVAKFHNKIGNTYYAAENYDKAVLSYQNSLTTYQKMGDRLASVAQVWTNLANTYRNLQQYSKALENYQKALDVYQKENNKSKLVETLKDLAVNYRKQNQPNIAIETYEKAVFLYQSDKSLMQLGDSSDSIGELYNRIGVIYSVDLLKFSNAISFYQKSLNYYKINNNEIDDIAQVLLNIGLDYHKSKEYYAAIDSYKRALLIYQNKSDFSREAVVWSHLSDTYRQLGDQDNAIAAYGKALQKNQAGINISADRNVSSSHGFNLSGIWKLDSSQTSGSGSRHNIGTVTISQIEQRYKLLWETSSGLRSGIGLTEDSQLFVGWSNRITNNAGLVVYQIREDGSLDGQWIEGVTATGLEKATGNHTGKIEGDYKVSGKNYDGRNYSGKLQIQKDGEAYRLFWDTGSEYRGVGIQVGNRLVVGWGDFGSLGVSAYEFKVDRLTGKSALLNQQKVNTEILIPSQIRNEKDRQKPFIIQLYAEANDLWAEGKQEESIKKTKEALEIAIAIDDYNLISILLQDLGMSYGTKENFVESLKYYEMALQRNQKSNNALGVANSLNLMGVIYNKQGKYDLALNMYKKLLDIAKNIKDIELEAVVLGNIANSYTQQGEYKKSLSILEKLLIFHQDIKDRSGEATTLTRIGVNYAEQSLYSQAIEYYQKAILIHNKANQISQIGITQINIGKVYVSQGDYQKALEFYEKSIEKIQSSLVKNRFREAIYFIEIGKVYSHLGVHQKSLEYYLKALSTYQELGYAASTGSTFILIGDAYVVQKKYSQSLKYYQNGLSIARSVGDVSQESKALYGLGQLYFEQEENQLSLEYLEKALFIQKKIGIRSQESATLNKLGQVQTQRSRFTEAQSSLQRSIALSQEIGDRPTEAQAYGNLAALFNKQNQPQIAIVFYKKSVSLYEDIRKGLAPLPNDQQQSYTNTVAQTYRDLADLLLKNDRILEARQVIELLKLQELEDYNKNTRGKTAPLAVLKAETEILNAFNQQIKSQYQSIREVQEEIEMLRKKLIDQEIPKDRNRKNELEKIIEKTEQQFLTFIDRKDIQDLIQILQKNDKTVPLSGDDLKTLQANLNLLQASQQNAAILFPLIFDDRIELLLITPNALLRRTVKQSENGKPFDRTQFNQQISSFLSTLTNPNDDPKPTAYQLYKHLIEPIEPDLKIANINTLIYGPDRRLRSVPIAALHDGKQWLVERYQVSNINAIGTTNFHSERNASPKVLAGSLSDNMTIEYQVKTPNSPDLHIFKGLPAAKLETLAIQKLIPSSTVLEDTNFQFDKIRDRIPDYNILHFATHGLFQLGKPEESFILFGGPDSHGKNYATLQDIKTWNISNIDLVILSACQTAVVADQNGDQLGIMGLGDSIQARGAKSSIASLWSVNDASTALLMQSFYIHLSQNKTKSEALRLAQIDLLKITDRVTQNQAIANLPRFKNMTITTPQANTAPKSPIAQGYSHPYYWAPFILIGNGR